MKKPLLTILNLTLALPAAAAEAGSGGGGLLGPSLKALAGLALVLGIVLLLYYVLSRKGLGGLLPAAKAGQIQVVEMRSLGPKKGVCLVRVRGEEFLLGVGADRVEFLTRVNPAPEGSFEKALNTSLEPRP
ncbi:hypothetical protein DESUT3_36920 [Desulfuromonas versatilis]|uniref:Flagellar protein n=1 Tax=Desulfuromonas versatilis TaxID=2802975 RepID=A0ABM8I0Y4_9BACT|nr:flagellar biosynthetic protein FliO [Desulfuromonas versatilis]BCR06623.1 hypothetical protein DESUT3_36920 [Desulfuromonas versatilis]